MKRTYGNLRLDGAHWIMDEIGPYAAMQLKRQFPKIPSGTAGPFAFSNRPDIAEDLRWFMARFPMLMKRRDAAALIAASDLHRRRVAEVEEICRPDWKPRSTEGLGFRRGVKLHDHQARNIEIAARFGRLLIMDELGAGKTHSGMGCILAAKTLPAAIIVQRHLMKQWARQITKFTTLTVHEIRRTTPYALPQADIYLFSYTQIAGWVDVVAQAPFRGVVFDEIQDIRAGEKTAKGKAARVFTAGADLRVGLSATPIYNYGDETWFIMDILEPGCLGTWAEFVTEWCSFRGKDKWIVNDPPALGSYLIDRHLVTRHKTDKRPVNQIVVEVDFDEEVEAKELNFAAALAQRVLHGSFTERGQASRELDMMARRITGLAKAASVAAYVRILVESGEPVILAGWHREVYAKWMELLGDLRPMLYTGTESASQKDKVAKAFISGACRLLIISLRSGAGLDGLQERGRFVVFGELDWTNACHSQLIGRLDRPGQKHEVTAIFCVTDGGSDPAIQGVLGLKDSQMRGITDPLAGTVTVHSDVDRFREIAKMYLAKAAAS